MADKSATDTSSISVLDNLRTFIAVVQKGSVVRGAEHVFKAPSGVTRSVMELEHKLGVALFERKPRGMMRNAYGQAVWDRAQRIQDEIESAADEFVRAGEQSKGLRNALLNLMFNSRKLQLLIGLSEYRSMSAAALHLGITQAGASMALSRMESTLGNPLFQRMMQGMVPTDAAARLVIRAKRVFSEIRHMEADLAAISGNLAGVVTIGTLPLGRTFVVPTGIAHALTLHPGLRVVTYESHYEQLIASLRSGDIDVVFGALRPNDGAQGLVTEALFNDRIGIIARTGHPLAGQANMGLQSMLDQQWILPPPNAPGRRLVEAFFRKAGLRLPAPSVETSDLAILRQLLKSTEMLTAISPHQLMFEIADGSLSELPTQIGETVRQIGFTLREGGALSSSAIAVLAAIRAQAQSMKPVTAD
jgi:LysR family transcriptional regulator, regulator for genes of the gallate degradation pathway